MNLSQDEINALLSGDSGGGDDAAEDFVPSDEFTDDPAYDQGDPSLGYENEAQAEYSNDSYVADPSPRILEEVLGPEYDLTPENIDILGEIGNMCMGAVATTMYALIDRQVTITTPRVSVHTTKMVLEAYDIPFIVVQVEYTEGIEGKNVLVLKQEDAAVITDLLMGGEGVITEPVELDELHMSAISEVMNQMMGASSTSLSKLLNKAIDISPPVTRDIGTEKDVSSMLDYSAVVIKVSFDMEIEGLLKSELLQLIPFDLGIDMSRQMMESGFGVQSSEGNGVGEDFLTSTPAQSPYVPEAASPPAPTSPPAPAAQSYVQPVAPQPQYAPPAQAAPYYAPPPTQGHGSFVDVHPVTFQPFDGAVASQFTQRGMELIHNIPLNVAVELGRAKKEIGEILDLGVGTLIVLDKTSGDPVEVVVNGKLIARGEVVVIDDSYGVRITEILGG